MVDAHGGRRPRHGNVGVTGRGPRAATIAAPIAGTPNNQYVKDSVQNELTKSFAGAEGTAEQFPQYANQITAAAKQSFLDGADWAYAAGLIAVVLGAALVFFLFPKREAEQRLLEQYHAEDTGRPEPDRLRAVA